MLERALTIRGAAVHWYGKAGSRWVAAETKYCLVAPNKQSNNQNPDCDRACALSDVLHTQ